MTASTEPRIIAWFSCGAASAVAAKLAVEQFRERAEVVYCDTMKAEHPDNARFFADVERWLGRKITVIRSSKYADIDEVFTTRNYMSGRHGAICTVEMKKVPRFNFQRADDVHVFGMTADEPKRIKNLAMNNPEMRLLWNLRDAGITKKDCFARLAVAGIELPAMYKLGYRNNNCIGCVKAQSPRYWKMVEQDFPEIFTRRAQQCRDLGVKLVKIGKMRYFIDELPAKDYSRFPLENISCGPECAPAVKNALDMLGDLA